MKSKIEFAGWDGSYGVEPQEMFDCPGGCKFADGTPVHPALSEVHPETGAWVPSSRVHLDARGMWIAPASCDGCEACNRA